MLQHDYDYAPFKGCEIDSQLHHASLLFTPHQRKKQILQKINVLHADFSASQVDNCSFSQTIPFSPGISIRNSYSNAFLIFLLQVYQK